MRTIHVRVLFYTEAINNCILYPTVKTKVSHMLQCNLICVISWCLVGRFIERTGSELGDIKLNGLNTHTCRDVGD
jgi:hypothetical protein